MRMRRHMAAILVQAVVASIFWLASSRAVRFFLILDQFLICHIFTDLSSIQLVSGSCSVKIVIGDS